MKKHIAGLVLAALIAPSILYGVDRTPTVPKVVLPVSTKAKRVPVKPTIPDVDRRRDKRVFLERANRLWMDEYISTDFSMVTGHVMFRKEGMYLFCDSANFYEKTGSVQAFGNVRMQQGDTLFVYAQELNYQGDTEFATFYGDGGAPVRLINKDVTLTTDIFYYDIAGNLGYYDNQGKISDRKNQLTSAYGQYSPDTKEATFRENVVLRDIPGKDFKMTTQELIYNTSNHIANIVSPTVIVTDSATVYSSSGWFDTEDEISELYRRSRVVSHSGNTLTGDTLYYNHPQGFGQAWGNMVLTDSAHQASLDGQYGYYYQSNDSAMATGQARIMEYSQGDTLYLHGDTVRMCTLFPDSTHLIMAYPNVRFWRTDIQGVCDSLAYTQRDSVMSMHRHPILWNEARQVFGGIIEIHLADSTVDWAKLPDYGFMAEHIGDEFYNQLSGKEMKATFLDGKLHTLDVSGNVEVISLPQENDSTYNKLVKSESSFLRAEFADQQLTHMTMWPEVTGTVTPLFMAKRSNYYLPSFQWYEPLRPTGPDDIFNRPTEMEALLNNSTIPTRRHRP